MKRKLMLAAICVMLVAAVLVVTACQQQKEVYSTESAEQQRAAKEKAAQAADNENKETRILADDEKTDGEPDRNTASADASKDSGLSVESQNLYNMALTQMKNDAKAGNTGNEMDPIKEEDEGEWEDIGEPSGDATSKLTFSSEYAGATPVLIDPIDKPTPTPLPELTFSYATYSIPQLGISFEGPSGWEVDESVPNTVILTNPDASVDFPARAEVTVEALGQKMSKSELTASVKDALKSINTADFKSFSPSNTAERSVLGNTGVYANYKGTLKDGTEVAGRLIKVCVNNSLLTIYCMYPRGYTDTYVKNVYDKIRHSIKFEG